MIPLDGISDGYGDNSDGDGYRYDGGFDGGFGDGYGGGCGGGFCGGYGGGFGFRGGNGYNTPAPSLTPEAP